MKPKKRLATFRLPPNTIKSLKALAMALDLSQAGVIELAVNRLQEALK